MQIYIETEQETDGRWIAEVQELPGVLAYGSTVDKAISRVQALALRVRTDQLEHGEAGPDTGELTPGAPFAAEGECDANPI